MRSSRGNESRHPPKINMITSCHGFIGFALGRARTAEKATPEHPALKKPRAAASTVLYCLYGVVRLYFSPILDFFELSV